MYAVERRIRGMWKQTAVLDHNPIHRLERLPKPHLRRVIDITTGEVWVWVNARIGYQKEVRRG